MNKNIALLFPLSSAIVIFSKLSIYYAGPYNSISLYQPLQLGILFLMLISILLVGNITLKLTKTMVLLIGFLSFAALSTFFSPNIRISLLKLIYMTRLSLMSFLIFLFLKKFWSLNFKDVFMRIMWWVGVIMATTIIASFFLSEIKTRSAGVMVQSNHSAGLLTTLLPFALYQLVEMQKRHNLSKSIIYNACWVVIIIGILLTGSRMGIVIASLSIFMVIITQRHYLLAPRSILIFGIIVILLISTVVKYEPFSVFLKFIQISFNTLWDFIFTKEEVGTWALIARYDLVCAGWRTFLGHPFFGIGLGNSGYAYDYSINEIAFFIGSKGTPAHNTFIELLSEIGLFGFIFFILLIVQIGKNLYFLYKASRNTIYLYFFISFINTCMVLFFLSEYNNHYLWGLFIPLSMYIDSKKRQWKLSHKFEKM